MIILGIETSCDETAVALLSCTPRVEILAEEISSQVSLHQAYGGVVPELASREHLKNLNLILDTVVRRASLKLDQISKIAVTVGPGLKGCLLIGAEFAKGLALSLGKPVSGANHIEGHLLAPMLDNPELSPPYLALIVSGGHTEIVLVHRIGRYEILSRTIDDAAGEAFDKSAALLGFPYPGGPKLAALADTVLTSRFALPKISREISDFSFSGLKTAVSLLVKKHKAELDNSPELRAELSFTVQSSIVESLIHKLEKAVKQTGLNKVAISGGVAANRFLRAKVREMDGVKPYFPTEVHSTDNAAMIAYASIRREQAKAGVLPLTIHPRWPVEDL